MAEVGVETFHPWVIGFRSCCGLEGWYKYGYGYVKHPAAAYKVWMGRGREDGRRGIKYL